MPDTQSRVLKVLIAALSLPDSAKRFTRDTPLLGTVPQLDSMSVLNVVLALEGEFGIQIPEYDISAAEFETLGALSDYVIKRQSHAATSPAAKMQAVATTAVIRTAVELGAHVAAWQKAGTTIGLVPTMGALHAGHMALIDAARAHCDKIVLTIFVNPGQFTPAAFATYPKTEQADIALAAAHGCDLVFAPPAVEVYPQGFSTTVSMGAFAGEFVPEGRPRYFDSVATIVSKLFLMSRANCAFFGEKDYEQLTVIRKMARDLNLPASIIGVPTVREADGLAMASSNRFLTAEERKCAPTLYAVLSRIASHLAHGETSIEQETKAGIESLLKSGFRKVDYLTVRDAETLEPISSIERPARVLATAWLGKPRLIDSVALVPSKKKAPQA